MRVAEAGRFVHPAEAAVPRRYLERNLLSIHGRGARLRAIAAGAHVSVREHDVEDVSAVRVAEHALGITHTNDWLLLRDYDGNGRERSVLFLFRDGSSTPDAVVKVRARDAGGASLKSEADALRSIAPLLDSRLRETVPRVRDFITTDTHELLVISAVPGCSLSILMQRSLRPRRSHIRHLLAAAHWLGAFHRATQSASHGDFWPRNILYARPDEVSGVVDWEHASTHGSQWNDVFLLPLLYATEAPSWRDRDRVEEFRSAFCDGRLQPVIDAYFEVYAGTAGVLRSVLRDRLAEYLRARDSELFDVFSGVR